MNTSTKMSNLYNLVTPNDKKFKTIEVIHDGQN